MLFSLLRLPPLLFIFAFLLLFSLLFHIFFGDYHEVSAPAAAAVKTCGRANGVLVLSFTHRIGTGPSYGVRHAGGLLRNLLGVVLF
ncbi:hypothetical protein BGZ63DRAFT_372591 [Mariannaea sp. PMI_226]|nr:hypothetical protein BGZ63DRAFT_372591 [Mariannaea sp. PMI_226]